MKIISAMYTLPCPYAYWYSYHRYSIGRVALSKVFNVPKDAEKIWLLLYTDQDGSREPMRVIKRFPAYYAIPVAILRSIEIGGNLPNRMWRFIGKTVYLECWYE